MLLDTQTLSQLLSNPFVTNAFKSGFVILSILYFIFSLIVIGQIRLMTDTVTTEAGSLLRFFSILHAGISLGIVVLFIAFFF